MQILKTNFVYSNPLIPLDLNKVKYIIIHHPDAITATPQQIHQWHLDNGWAGFGYNEYIRKDGAVYIGRGDNIGAQCQNFNSVSYGICCEGNYDVEKIMPDVQFNSLVERVNFHKNRFKKFELVAPHRDFGNSSCPGRYFPFDKLKNKLEVKTLKIEDALQILQKEGVISSPDFWTKCADVVKYLDVLVVNMAQKIIDLKNK